MLSAVFVVHGAYVQSLWGAYPKFEGSIRGMGAGLLGLLCHMLT